LRAAVRRVSALMQRAQSSLGYLKIVTPRAESSACSFAFFSLSSCFIPDVLILFWTASDTGVQRFIYRDGKRVNAAEFEANGEENARYKTQDIEAGLKRHHQLLRRQYFMDRKSGPPRPIF
jgi:hypothetical protein